MKFIIDRSKWRCGDSSSNQRGLGETRLLNSQNFMCCLGHIALQINYSEEQIFGAPEPSDIRKNRDDKILCQNQIVGNWDEEPESYNFNTTLSDDAIIINDHPDLCDEDRESKLVELFKEHGHELEFINDFYFPEGKPEEEVEE